MLPRLLGAGATVVYLNGQAKSKVLFVCFVVKSLVCDAFIL